MKNTGQITKAMKMVAASKLRRAQQSVMNARPYAIQLKRVLSSAASRVDASIHPLLTVREPTANSKTLVIVVTGDKGLCGGFNTNILKAASAFVLDTKTPCDLGLVGRKGRDFFVRRGFSVAFEQVGIFNTLRFEDAKTIGQLAADRFLSGEVDRVVLIYNEFKSVMTQRVVVDQLLPIATAEVSEDGAEVTAAAPAEGYQPVDYLYEPSAQEIFDQLLPRYIDVQVYRVATRVERGVLRSADDSDGHRYQERRGNDCRL